MRHEITYLKEHILIIVSLFSSPILMLALIIYNYIVILLTVVAQIYSEQF